MEEFMLTAANVMTTDVVSIGPDKPVREIAEILFTRRISGVPVVDADARVIGIVSEGDLIGHAAIVGEHHRSWWLSLFTDESVTARDYVKAHGRTARDVMSTDVVTVEETATLAEIVDLLQRHRIKRVPVVQGGRLVGIVTRGNLLQGLAALKVEPPRKVDDQTIHDQLMRELRSQPWAHVLDVIVENGVVHLHGTFQTEDERRALLIAAENVPGVKRVEDRLTPWSSAPTRYSGVG
jgi:CBS-domain-containing membrane protein